VRDGAAGLHLVTRMLRMWPRKEGRAPSATRLAREAPSATRMGREGWGERSTRYTKGGSLDSRYNGARAPGVLVAPVPPLHLHPAWHPDPLQPRPCQEGGGRGRSRSRTRHGEEGPETKKISRVESLKNLILHGKSEPEAPPEVFTFPHGCNCRHGGSQLRQSGRRSKSSERPPGTNLPAFLGYPAVFSPQDTFRLRRRNSSLENLNQIFFRDETSDKPKENRVVKFHDEAPERGRPAKKSMKVKKELKSRSLIRTSTSILKESRDVESCTEHAPVRDDDKRMLPECPKKKEKKKKRAKFDEKHGRKSLPTSPLLQRSERAPPPLPVPLNLSTEESGYESDLTRKTSSKGSDSSQSNSPVSSRSVVLLPSPSSYQPLLATLGDSETASLSQASIASSSYSSCPGDSPDHTSKKVTSSGFGGMTEIVIGHPADRLGGGGQRGRVTVEVKECMRKEENLKRNEEEESTMRRNEEEERGDERDLSLESITTTNGAIVTSCASPGSSESGAVKADFLLGLDPSPTDPGSTSPLACDEDEGTTEIPAANKTDEEKLTSVSLSDEEKLTAIFLCTDGPTVPGAGPDQLESIDIDPEESAAPVESTDTATSVQPAPKIDVWERNVAEGSAEVSAASGSLLSRLPPSSPPPPPPREVAERILPAAGEEIQEADDSEETQAGDTCALPPDAEEEVATAEESLLSIRDILEPFAATSSCVDMENVTSLQVEWSEATPVEEVPGDLLVTPFGRGLVQEEPSRPLGHLDGLTRSEDPQSSLPIDFGDSLPPRLTGLVNKQFRMYRLVKEAGMELGVLITKKFNEDQRTTGYIVAYIEPQGLVHRDGRFKVNDEIINVNGSSLRGLSMEQARNVLKNTATNVDIIIARSPEGGKEGRSPGPKPLARRKRRLPVIERPKSAPLAGEAAAAAGHVHDVCDFSGSHGGIKTVIQIPPEQAEAAGHALLAAAEGCRSGSRAGERVLPEIPRRGEEPLLLEEGARDEEARRSLQITVHTAAFQKGPGNKGLGFR